MRILIAEDEIVSRHVLKATLEKAGYEVEAVTDGAAAWDVLQAEDAPHLAIIDWMMPNMDGLQVCRQVRQKKAKNYTYILLLTAKSEREDVIKGLEAGADDYLVKPFDAQELRARLNVGRRILELHNKLLYLCQELEIRATRDSLTGTWNRPAILERLDQEIALAIRNHASVGIVMADVDHFKRVNDTHGHAAGDHVLRETTRNMRLHLRTYDAMGRYGGEEFLIILPGCSLATTAQLAERLRAQVAEKPVLSGETEIAVTASYGTTAYEPGTITDCQKLINVADDALYRAKRSGRNCVIADPAPLFAVDEAANPQESVTQDSELSVINSEGRQPELAQHGA